MDNFKIQNLLPCEAIAWQEAQGVVGILNSRAPEFALGAFVGTELAGVRTFSSSRLIGLLVKSEFRRRGIGRAMTISALDQIIPALRDGEFVIVETNHDSGKLIEGLPSEYRARVYERGWYD